MSQLYSESKAAEAASKYFKSLPLEERTKLAPLLEHYRQMGLAEACGHLDVAVGHIRARVRGIQDAGRGTWS